MSHIVVCDDDKSILEVLRELLPEIGHTVEITTDPNLVLSLLDKKPCDLAIFDYQFEKVTGKDLLLEVRKKYSPAEVPVVFLSGIKDIERLKEVAKLGISGFYLKPPDYKNLPTKIQEVVAHRLSVTDVRSLLLLCNIADKDLYKASGLGPFKEKGVPLYNVQFNGRNFVVAQLGRLAPNALAQSHGPSLIKDCRVMVQFGTTWFRIWPTSWMLAAAKRSLGPLPVAVPKKDLDAIFEKVNKALE